MEFIKSGIISIHGVADSGIGGRSENQDDFGFYDTPLGFLAVVCDGMGGGPGGKTASYIAKYEISTALSECNADMPRENAFKMAVSRAQDSLQKRIQENPMLSGMGSTFVAVLINKDSVTIAHAGDSRCYIFRGNKCIYRSNDHSLVAELVKNKALTEEEARTSPQSNIITRGLGCVSNNVAEIDEIPYRKGDRIVLCSDGIWGALKADELKKRLTQKINLDSIASNLSNEVDNIGNLNGGHHDNHTIIMMDLDMDSSAAGKTPDKKIILYCCLAGIIILSLLCYYIFFFTRDKSNVAESSSIPESALYADVIDPSPSMPKQPDYPDMPDSLIIDTDSVGITPGNITTDSLKRALQNTINEFISANEIEKQNDKVKQETDSADNIKKTPDPKENNSINTPLEAIDKMKEIVNNAKGINAEKPEDARKQISDYQSNAKDLMSSDLFNEAISKNGASYKKELKLTINDTKWYVDKTMNKETRKFGVTHETEKLLKRIDSILDSISYKMTVENQKSYFSK